MVLLGLGGSEGSGGSGSYDWPSARVARCRSDVGFVAMCKVTRLMPSKVFRVTWYRIGISALVRTLGNT